MERWLVTGASGQLGGHSLHALGSDPALKRVLAMARSPILGESETAQVELADPAALQVCARAFRPSHVLHIGAMTAVSECFARPDDATRVNTIATQALAEAAAEFGARFVFVSTDMVFAGDRAPYAETDPPLPLSQYGRTKAAAEIAIQHVRGTVTVRLPLLFGYPRTARTTTFASQIAALRDLKPLKLFTDEHRTPLWLPDAAAALLLIARSEATGVLHVAGPQRLSRYEMLTEAAAGLGVTESRLIPISRLSVQAGEPRPADLSLRDDRFASLFPRFQKTPLRKAMTQG